MTGLKSIALAAGLMLAGVGQAQAAAAPAQPVAAASAPAATTPAAAPAATDPNLAMDGAPAMTATAGIGQPTAREYHLQPQVTENGQRAHWMHDAILMPVISVISLFVLFLLLWVVFRFRRGANPTPSRTSHNTFIEVVWTLVPVIILVLIAVPSIGLLQAQFKPAPKGAVTLKAIGNQWYWSYQYPDNGGFEVTANMLKEPGQAAAGERTRTDADGPPLLATDNRVVLPVGVPIRLITTSNDVIHSWGVPAFWMKLDAIPGRLNETSFTIKKPGLYFGQCSELCGARHAYMPIAVEAVPPAQFAAWVKAKGGTMPVLSGANGTVEGPGTGTPSAAAPAQAGASGAATVPQSGAFAPANAVDPAAAVSANGATPVTNRATGNPAGAGNAGQ